MWGTLLWRLVREVSPRCLGKIAGTLAWRNMWNIFRFERRQRLGKPFFPAFMILSVTDRCNLSCQGCWVGTAEPADLPLATMTRVIAACQRRGSAYVGIVGGEPFLHPDLFPLFERFPDCYFQVFTNGTLLTPAVARAMQRLGNVTPLISFEGLGAAADQRRGGDRIQATAEQAMANCRREGLLIGVAASICQTNLDDLVNDAFVEALIAQGVHYLWYYLYRPVGPRPHPELALRREQILRLRRFLVEARTRFPIALVDAYWDADGNAICPGAIGLSHHLNAHGDLEFCPPVQFSRDRLGTGSDLAHKLRESSFLMELRRRVSETTRGCILLNDPQRLAGWMAELEAGDSTGRGSALRELTAMTCQSCHHIPGEEIPEASLIYRLAKRLWFCGFGAYG